MKEGRSGLFTDFYELTMAEGFFKNNHNPNTVFEMFYRNAPLNSGYAIFVGIDEVVDNIEHLHFSNSDIAYLKRLGVFSSDFLDYLKNFRFSGDVYAFDEGEVCFPREPLLRVEAPLLEACLIETMLLNSINFQTLIATKASRLKTASGGRAIMEFGMRRAASGTASVLASRAAIIGGADSTSNTFAAKEFALKPSGTMSHAWVMSFESELEAFRTFASLFPDNAILLIDTYDTLKSGIENAIIVGKEQKAKGKSIGVRIDSGDLAYLSKKIREKLNSAGLTDAKICLSNDIDENVLRELFISEAEVDAFGIGTKLVADGATLGGVYKMVAKEGENGFENVLKMSNSAEKLTLPGAHSVRRIYDASGHPLSDYISLKSEMEPKNNEPLRLHHSVYDLEEQSIEAFKYSEELLKLKLKNGITVQKKRSVNRIKRDSAKSLSRFDESYKRLINPHIYKVSISTLLKNERNRLVNEYKKKG